MAFPYSSLFAGYVQKPLADENLFELQQTLETQQHHCTSSVVKCSHTQIRQVGLRHRQRPFPLPKLGHEQYLERGGVEKLLQPYGNKCWTRSPRENLGEYEDGIQYLGHNKPNKFCHQIANQLLFPQALRAANYLLMVEMDYQMCQNRTKINIV